MESDNTRTIRILNGPIEITIKYTKPSDDLPKINEHVEKNKNISDKELEVSLTNEIKKLLADDNSNKSEAGDTSLSFDDTPIRPMLRDEFRSSINFDGYPSDTGIDDEDKKKKSSIKILKPPGGGGSKGFW